MGRGNDESNNEPAKTFPVQQNPFLMRLVMLTPGRPLVPRANPYGYCFARMCLLACRLCLQVKITDVAHCFPLYPPQFNSWCKRINLCAGRCGGVWMIYRCHIHVCHRPHIKLVDLLKKRKARLPKESHRFPCFLWIQGHFSVSTVIITQLISELELLQSSSV